MLNNLELLDLGIYTLQYRDSTNQNMLGKYGFKIMLDHDFSKRALDIEVTMTEYKSYKHDLKNILSEFNFTESIRGYPPISFIKSRNPSSFRGLINFCTTPGSIHDLMLEPSYLNGLERGLRDDLVYRTVNVNDIMQSKALLRMWEKWLETIADAIIGDEIIN